jgi:hypothetical protein
MDASQGEESSACASKPGFEKAVSQKFTPLTSELICAILNLHEQGETFQPAILTEEEVVPKMDSSMKRSAVASLLAVK